jgi:uncharacterized protein (DUF924 family)
MTTLLHFWFPADNSGELKFQNFWFDETKDTEIFEKFNSELKKYENEDMEEISKHDDSVKFHFVILFDQITRNISRLTQDNEFKNDSKAIHLSHQLISSDYDITLPFLKRVFILLPFRHSNKMVNLNFVIERLNFYHPFLKDNEKNDYQKFYIATLKNYTELTENIQIFKPCQQKIIFDESIHDENCKSYQNIISNVIVPNINKEPLYKNIIFED